MNAQPVTKGEVVLVDRALGTFTEMFKVPAFEWKDRKFPAKYLSKEIKYLGTGRPARELGPLSISLGYQSALFEIALLTQLGVKVDVPEDVVKTALSHYETITSQVNRGKGNWNDTIVNYDMNVGQPSLWRRMNGYERIAVIDDSDWKMKDGVWVPKNEKAFLRTDAPKPGFAALTGDGLYQGSGFAFETASRQEAISKLKDFALKHGKDEKSSQEFAERNVSYQHRRNKGTGYSPACRGFDVRDDGPFYVNANWIAVNWHRNLGSFPSRSSEKK
jgi:hypothetical protein